MIGRVLVPGPYTGAQIRASLAGASAKAGTNVPAPGGLQPATGQKISIEGVVVSECLPLTAG